MGEPGSCPSPSPKTIVYSVFSDVCMAMYASQSQPLLAVHNENELNTPTKGVPQLLEHGFCGPTSWSE